jgi:mono/diheme cytochrome c family protein
MNNLSAKWRRILLVLGAIVVLLGLLAYGAWYKLFRRVHTFYTSEEDHWKYGSIGVEAVEGMPYWIWLELPKIFPDKLPRPGGYTSLGMVWEEGKEMPIGFTKEVIGFPRVGINCAACHTGTFRATAHEKPSFILAAPSTKFDSQAYVRFLFACANDPRFDADTIMTQLNYDVKLALIDRLLYRYAIIPFTKKSLKKQEQSYAFMRSRPNWGPGRTDMNPFKLRVMGLPDDGSVGSTDIMAIWNQKAREGTFRHSDGLNTTLVEAVRSAALASGANRSSIDIPSLDRIQTFITNLAPPKYPFLYDQELASKGGEIFEANCASCHVLGRGQTGKVIPYTETGTDPNRADHWTKTAADAFNEYAKGYPWKFNNFCDSDGYVALPMEGVWARAPYLHNGSVPTLADLLNAPAARPAVFYRGYDVYDQERVGFVHEGPDAERVGYRFNTAERGNSNAGHTHGTQLSPDDKRALIEFLKTL